MSDNAPNGGFNWNAVLLAAVAAGCGWLLYSRAGGDKLAEGIVERVQTLTSGQRPPRVVPRKIAVDEPMAGYGA